MDLQLKDTRIIIVKNKGKKERDIMVKKKLIL